MERESDFECCEVLRRLTIAGKTKEKRIEKGDRQRAFWAEVKQAVSDVK